MSAKSLVLILGFVTLATSAFVIDLTNGRFHVAPLRAMRNIRMEMAKRSMASNINQFAGLDTLGGMGLGKRGVDDEKRAALSTFDSLAGMGLGKRSSVQELSHFDSLGGMGFGRK